MTCEELMALFSRYVDGELPAGGCEEIEEHAARCGRCSDFLDEVRKTVALCRGLKTGESPRPLGAEVRERLRELYQQSRGSAPSS